MRLSRRLFRVWSFWRPVGYLTRVQLIVVWPTGPLEMALPWAFHWALLPPLAILLFVDGPHRAR